MYLLDTSIFLWAAGSPAKLPKEIKQKLVAEDSRLFVSIVSLWEISIKVSLKRLRFPISKAGEVVESLAAEVLALSLADIQGLSALPLHHRDPFDRMLIAQAKGAGLTVLTSDKEFSRYSGVKVVLG